MEGYGGVGPSYGGVWGLKSLGFEGARAVNGASGHSILHFCLGGVTLKGAKTPWKMTMNTAFSWDVRRCTQPKTSALRWFSTAVLRLSAQARDQWVSIRIFPFWSPVPYPQVRWVVRAPGTHPSHLRNGGRPAALGLFDLDLCHSFLDRIGLSELR